jgi:predicted DNA binding CopG/RHH family protein
MEKILNLLREKLELFQQYEKLTFRLLDISPRANMEGDTLDVMEQLIMERETLGDEIDELNNEISVEISASPNPERCKAVMKQTEKAENELEQNISDVCRQMSSIVTKTAKANEDIERLLIRARDEVLDEIKSSNADEQGSVAAKYSANHALSQHDISRTPKTI